MESGQRIAQLEIPYEQIGQRDEVPVWWCATEYLVIGSHLCHLGMGLCYRRDANRPLGYLAQGRLWIDVQTSGHSCLVPAEIPLPNDRVTIRRTFRTSGRSCSGEMPCAWKFECDRAPRAAFPGELSSRVRQRWRKSATGRRRRPHSVCKFRSPSTRKGPPPSTSGGEVSNRQAFTVPNRILCLTLELLDSRVR